MEIDIIHAKRPFKMHYTECTKPPSWLLKRCDEPMLKLVLTEMPLFPITNNSVKLFSTLKNISQGVTFRPSLAIVFAPKFQGLDLCRLPLKFVTMSHHPLLV